MPRKTKDQNEVNNENNSKSSRAQNAKKDSIIDKIKQTLNIPSNEEIKDEKTPKVDNKKTTSKATAKKESTKKGSTTIKKEETKKSVSPKTSSKAKPIKKDINEDSKKSISTKTSTRNSSKKTSIKDASKKTTTKTSNKITIEKTKKAVEKKSASKKALNSNSTKKAVKSKTTVANSKNKKRQVKQVETPQIVEYYDLPYRYNQTLVKLLYQTPTTLFVYWDISDKDRENYKHIYGENFFEITKPVLIFHNITLNYSQELDINDFANSWYIHVNDSNSEYIVELGRRPIYYNAEIKEDYIFVSSSNNMIIPNDKILFNIDILDSLYFKNVKSGEDKYIKLVDLIKKVNPNGFPLINFNSLNKLYEAIYGNENIEEIYNLNNPSSGNPSSGSLSSKFL